MRGLTTAALQLGALAAGTLVSEDLTCLSAGLLIRSGAVDHATALLGCFTGIVAGDVGLWAVGRAIGSRMRAARWLDRWVDPERIRRAERWLDGNLPKAVLASRFMPGSRLPLYLAAGMLGRSMRRFLLWTLVAAALWTPLVVLSAAWLGPVFTSALGRLTGGTSAWQPGLAIAAVYLAWKGGARAVSLARSRTARARLAAAVSRIWRWEFWPACLFYLPLGPWIALLSIRYRGFTSITAANPSLPDGGFVGESKSGILEGLPARWVAPHALIRQGDPGARVATLLHLMEERGWAFPLVLKPDVGQRGDAVRLIADRTAALSYLTRFPAPAIAQVYHPGPHEAGIFYYRFPNERRGRIFSVTDKRFPMVAGDGRSTLEDLIWAHPRYRMQAETFLARLGPQRLRIPAPAETVRLCFAGNHVQGTMFRDGRDLITPALERRVDRIARAAGGFYFGRFDVRYGDPEGLRAGRDLTIVELNGVTSESTNIYDPERGLIAAYRTLFRQWAILFRIGALNRRRGCRATPMVRLIGKVVRHYRSRPTPALAD